MLQEVTPYIVFFSGFAILMTFVVGFFAGWITNNVIGPVSYTHLTLPTKA